MSSNPSGPTSATPRHSALIQPASIERLLAETRKWDALDQAYTEDHGALEAAISDARKDVSRRNLTAAPETIGVAAASPDAAIIAILSARQRLANAAQARVEVGTALHAAREAAERALADASDVLVARRFIAVVAALLLALALLVVFNG